MVCTCTPQTQPTGPSLSWIFLLFFSSADKCRALHKLHMPRCAPPTSLQRRPRAHLRRVLIDRTPRIIHRTPGQIHRRPRMHINFTERLIEIRRSNRRARHRQPHIHHTQPLIQRRQYRRRGQGRRSQAGHLHAMLRRKRVVPKHRSSSRRRRGNRRNESRG